MNSNIKTESENQSDCTNDIKHYQCVECPNYRTNSMVHLTQHIRDDHGEELQSEAFNECTETQPNLSINQLKSKIPSRLDDQPTQPEETQWFKCGHCPLIFKHKDQLKCHLPLHGTSSQNAATLPFKCDQCPYVSRRKGNVDLHVISSHPKPLKIPLEFNPEFKKKDTLKARVKRFYTSVEELRDLSMKRKQCPYERKEKDELQGSEKTHKQILFDCSTEIEKYKCEKCSNFDTNLLTTLRTHIQNGHRNTNLKEEANSYKCLKCSFETHSRYVLVQHCHSSECASNDQFESNQSEFSGSKSVGTNGQYPSNPDSTNRFNCPHCPSKFRNLRSHILRVHTRPQDIQWLQCEQCPLKFKEKYSLSRHVNCCHADPDTVRWFQCEKCPSRFKRNYLLTRHTASTHTEPLAEPQDVHWFQCEHCPSKFKRKLRWKKHTEMVHTKPERTVQCEQCPSKFTCLDYMKQHAKLCHSRPEDIKWFECERCPSRFKRRGGLAKHVLYKHARSEDIQWFHCEQCPGRFKLREELTRHVKYCHTKPEDIQWFQCELCPSKFRHEKYLKQHTKFCHRQSGDIQWFECEQCPAKFKRKTVLVKHARRHAGLKKSRDVTVKSCQTNPKDVQ